MYLGFSFEMRDFTALCVENRCFIYNVNDCKQYKLEKCPNIQVDFCLQHLTNILYSKIEIEKRLGILYILNIKELILIPDKVKNCMQK